jgi:signal transduction histidine kinase
MTAAGLRRPYGIRKRVAWLVACGALAPMLLAGWLTWSAYGEVSNHLLDEHELLAGTLALHFDDVLRTSLADVSAAVGTPEDWRDGNAKRSLRTTVLRSPLFDAIVVLDAEKKITWQEVRHRDEASEASSAAEAQKTALALPEVGAALASGRQGVASVRSGDGSHVVLLVPVRDWNGQLESLVCALINPSAPAWLAMLRHGRLGSGSASLVDDKGRLLASTDARAQVPPMGQDDIHAVGTLTLVPWQVVLRQPRAEALGPLVQQSRRMFLLSPLLLIAAVLFSWGATHSVTQPLKALNIAARRIAEGNLDTAVPVQAHDEVGQLGRSLEAMRVALKRSLDELTESHNALEQRVEARTQELRQLLTKFVSVQEDERRRIARELHDETCQTLAALGMKLDAALSAPSAEAARTRLIEARTFSGRTLADIHALIYDLRPSVLDDLGLFPAIRWLAEHHLTKAGIAWRCEVTQAEHTLAPVRETTLFRAAQEAIRNVARHSAAEQVLIQVEERDGHLQVEIEDDGHGFDPASVSQPSPSGRGLGLLGMRERLSIVGGSAEVFSSSESGTRVVLRVPFEEEKTLG